MILVFKFSFLVGHLVPMASEVKFLVSLISIKFKTETNLLAFGYVRVLILLK